MAIDVCEPASRSTPAASDRSFKVRLTSRRANATSSVCLEPQGLSVSIGYEWIESGETMGGRIASLFGLKLSRTIVASDTMTLAFSDAGRLSKIAVDRMPYSWRYERLSDTARWVSPVYMRPLVAADRYDIAVIDLPVEVIRDVAAAQLAIRAGRATRWHALADNLVLGTDERGRFCEFRVYGFPNDPINEVFLQSNYGW